MGFPEIKEDDLHWKWTEWLIKYPAQPTTPPAQPTASAAPDNSPENPSLHGYQPAHEMQAYDEAYGEAKKLEAKEAEQKAKQKEQAEAIRKAGDSFNRTRLTPFVKKLLRKWLAWTR